MNMSWAVVVSVHQVEQLSSWSIARHLESQNSTLLFTDATYRIRCRSQTVEGIFALGVGDKLAAKVVVDLVGILLLIQSYNC